MLLSTSTTLYALLSTFLLVLIHDYTKKRRMPPGPQGIPVLGNKHQMPATKPWFKFADLNKQYGSVVSLFFGQTPIIVLGTAKAAWDLLEGRSQIYSSRPRFVVAGEILSENRRGLMLPYGEAWRRWRKVLHTGFHARKAESYTKIQSLESALAVHDTLVDPDHWERHLQRYAASVVTTVSYDRRVNSIDEWIVVENMQAMDYLTSVNIPGKYLVESLPILLRLPRFLQFFRAEPQAQKQRDITLYMNLMDEVKERMTNGTAKDCLATQILQEQGKSGLDDLDVAYALASPFGAGIETTAGTLSSFLLAMLHYPDVMRTAQEELDEVVGASRLPNFEDRENLPYIRAVVNEALRWRPVAVLGGQAHASTAEDTYEGWRIPNGSTVFANLAGIMMDEQVFPAPDSFSPERFLDASDPRFVDFTLPFGFGRRICPGLHLARNSLFINISRFLWAFDIRPVEGQPLPDSGPDGFTDGFNSRPKPFKARFLVRSEERREVIERDWVNAKSELSA